MKKTVFVLAILTGLQVNAQNYLVNFTGTGASTTVTTIDVENLTRGTFLTLNGNDILSLTLTTGISPFDDGNSPSLKIFPNPMTGISILQVYPPETGDIEISLTEMSGRPVTRLKSYSDNSLQEYRLSGINTGLYLITVSGKTFRYSEKLLSTGKTVGTICIERITSNNSVVEGKEKPFGKGSMATVDMEYSTGDRLKFKGKSGNYSTIVTDVFTGDKTINFNFIECADGDGNNYPVVEIGSQIWMAANLKTTKYRDGTEIPTETGNSAWSNLTTPAYCWYNNDAPAYKEIYGALYNWYAVSTGNLCPVGWHAPTSSEWTTLLTNLGGENGAGAKLKETGTSHWTAPNTGALNSTGFTLVPGGVRHDEYLPFFMPGIFKLVRNEAWFTAYDDVNPTTAYYLEASYMDDDLDFRNSAPKDNGFSVRCLKD